MANEAIDQWRHRLSACVDAAGGSVVVKTFFEISRPRSRPWVSGLETKTKTFGFETLALNSRHEDRDLGKMKNFMIGLREESFFLQHYTMHSYRCLLQVLVALSIHKI